MRVLNKMPTNDHLKSQNQNTSKPPMYSFVATEIYKNSSTYGTAQFFLTMDKKDWIDNYIDYSNITNKRALFCNNKNPK